MTSMRKSNQKEGEKIKYFQIDSRKVFANYWKLSAWRAVHEYVSLSWFPNWCQTTSSCLLLVQRKVFGCSRTISHRQNQIDVVKWIRWSWAHGRSRRCIKLDRYDNDYQWVLCLICVQLLWCLCKCRLHHSTELCTCLALKHMYFAVFHRKLPLYPPHLLSFLPDQFSFFCWKQFRFGRYYVCAVWISVLFCCRAP